MKGSQKQINWALNIRRKRLAVWSRSPEFKEIEPEITAIDDSTWWIANREKLFVQIYYKMKADAVAAADLTSFTRIDTLTGLRFIGPTRNVVAGEVVVDEGGSMPF